MKFLIAAVLTLILTTSYCQTKELSSPNGRIRIAVTIDKGITYSVSFDNKLILASSSIDLILKNGKALSEHASLKKAATKQVRETILPPVAEKRKVIPDNYNELSLTFKQKFTINFRAYDDGIAYRFATSKKDTLFVYNEVSEYNFPENHEVYYPEVARRDNLTKESVEITNIVEHVKTLLEDIQTNIYNRALKFREENTHVIDTWEDFKSQIEKGGFIMAHWDGTGETEEKIKEETKATIRCIPLEGDKQPGKCVYSGKDSAQRVVFARAY